MKESQQKEQQEKPLQTRMTIADCLSDLTNNQLLTPVDKLYAMANKNPDIELLIKEFNLQII